MSNIYWLTLENYVHASSFLFIFSAFTLATKKQAKMEFYVSAARLQQCSPYSCCMHGFMRCDFLDSYVTVGDVIVVARPRGPNVVGRLIDVSLLDKINVDEISLDDEDYFF